MRNLSTMNSKWLLLALLLNCSAPIYFRSVTSESIVYYPITATSRFWMCHTVG